MCWALVDISLRRKDKGDAEAEQSLQVGTSGHTLFLRAENAPTAMRWVYGLVRLHAPAVHVYLVGIAPYQCTKY
jgi:hypothetical protein